MSMQPAPPLPTSSAWPAPSGDHGFGLATTVMSPPPTAFGGVVGPAPLPVAPAPAPAPPVAPAPALPAPRPVATPGLAPMPSSGATARLAALHAQLAQVHGDFLRQQAELHQRFLAVREQQLHTLMGQAGARSGPPTLQTVAPAPVPVVAPVAPTPPPPAPAPAPAPVAAEPVAPPPAPAPTKPTPTKPTPTRPAPAPAPSQAAPARPVGVNPRATCPASELPGPKWDRHDLEVLASDKISAVYGPMFAIQDDFPRQVRMPEPPLLLADRVIGIDAEPGSMKTGVIWTETDVTWDAWYLHDGHMPAGVMIESGQADLLLISWLGADFQNKGERVYRLLGCELTYRGGLPAPGDTLRYEIHVDGHANHGDTRIFFFHYDCWVDGKPRLEVRQGQAGFFSDAELANSGGILWSAETGEHDPKARLDAPPVACTRSSFDADQVLAFANGDAFACFGEGFELAQTHVRTPRMAPPPLTFWKTVSAFDPKGGPWKRGYLRCEQPIAPTDWFFDGHFKDDPCMPGTMMMEACLHAASFYLTALGVTLKKDGWRFEPVPDLPYMLKCRGQVTPESKHVVYEVFVEEFHAGPHPTLFADFLCTVDGLKAFHARRVGVKLLPDWPISSRPEILDGYVDPVPVAEAEGFKFGYHSLMACAWGRPSEAFGPMYIPFDGGRHCARLPGPPYHFMTRVVKIDGAIGKMEIGTRIELEYDVPPESWYFVENGCPSMPYCVLLEAALQPCGWIACYVGSALTTDLDLLFRNLDGTATWHTEVLPTSGTLKTVAKITNISPAGGMIIENFEVQCFIGDTCIYTMKTVFGFFPPEAFANQVGLPPTPAEREALHAPNDFLVDLTARPEKYCGGKLRLPGAMLLMLDRVTGYWPEGGKKGLGKLRSEKDVDPAEWFFKAHFYTDPVQPGSLGIEAMIQLLQFYMLEKGMGEGMENPRFEPLMMGRELSWKYRGQVVPKNHVIYCEVDIVEVGEDARGRYAICDAYLWVDQIRIYQATGMGMRIVDDLLPPPPTQDDDDDVLDPEGWVADHKPTFSVPALPAMSMMDRLAGAGQAALGGEVLEVTDGQVLRWLPVAEPTKTRTRVESTEGDRATVVFEAWRTAGELSRFEAVAKGTVRCGPSWPAPPEPWEGLAESTPVPDPYAAGQLFHGPAYQVLTRLAFGPNGSEGLLDAARDRVPHGTLGQGLLDGLTHLFPHDDVHRWDPAVGTDQVAYPFRVDRLAVFGPRPTGEVRVVARYLGRPQERHPRFGLQALDLVSGKVWAELEVTEVLFPKGPIGSAPPEVRLAFLRDRRPVPGLGLSVADGDATVAHLADIKASDWLPGTVQRVYGAAGSAPAQLLEAVALGDHVARLAPVHPGTVRRQGDLAVSSMLPLNRFPVAVELGPTMAAVQSTGPEFLDLQPVRDWWDRVFQVGRWPVEDVFYGLMKRFVHRVHTPWPDELAAVHGRSLLYLGNHQIGVESLLFSILASALNGMSTVTLAKIEHKKTWLGQLIAHAFSWPGVDDPNVITFFDREDKASLPSIIADLSRQMTTTGKSVMVHVEGTRSLECRTPVSKMSSAFVDMALATRAPIVPVRFAGALPATPMPKRLEYPTGLGQQDIWMGKPIHPEELEALPFKDRKEHVLAAINGLGPRWEDDEPFPGHPDQLERAFAWAETTGAEPVHAFMLEVLMQLEEPTEPILRLREAVRKGTLTVSADPEGRWLATLAERLYGPRGPRIHIR